MRPPSRREARLPFEGSVVAYSAHVVQIASYIGCMRPWRYGAELPPPSNLTKNLHRTTSRGYGTCANAIGHEYCLETYETDTMGTLSRNCETDFPNPCKRVIPPSPSDPKTGLFFHVVVDVCLGWCRGAPG